MINVIPPELEFSDLEDELCSKFNLDDAVVILGSAGPSRLLTQNLGMAGAGYLDKTLESGHVVGVSWGATLRELVTALNEIKPDPREIMVVPLLGGQGQASPGPSSKRYCIPCLHDFWRIPSISACSRIR
jgi:deoxyribonucleoside regulator